jgi:hypothetical protein
LGLVLTLYHRQGSLDIAAWHTLREDNQPAFVDQEVPEPEDRPHEWPMLTPAGMEPAPDLEEVTHRTHV